MFTASILTAIAIVTDETYLLKPAQGCTDGIVLDARAYQPHDQKLPLGDNCATNRNIKLPPSNSQSFI